MEGWAASGARPGIEYAHPLLDRRVLEFALGLPRSIGLVEAGVAG